MKKKAMKRRSSPWFCSDSESASASGVPMEAEMKQWWEWLCLVFAKLDGKNLALCCCVAKTWRALASQEELWERLCLAKWPGALGSSGYGRDAVRIAGGYRQYYSIRLAAIAIAARSISGRATSRRRAQPNPRLKLEELLFLLDVQHKAQPVCSLVRGGEALKPMFPNLEQDAAQASFRFVVEIDTSLNLNNTNSSMLQWSKKQIKEFTVSWAVMIKGSPKLFQILHTQQPGQVVGNSCNYSERLPIHSCSCCCCCLTSDDTNHVAEVDLDFAAAAVDSSVGDTCQNLYLRELRCSILNTDCWRYFTQAQALQYLQHALLHDCLSL